MRETIRQYERLVFYATQLSSERSCSLTRPIIENVKCIQINSIVFLFNADESIFGTIGKNYGIVICTLFGKCRMKI